MSQSRRRAAAQRNVPTPSADIPAGYFGPRIEGQAPNLCHRHKRTIATGHSCDMGRLEQENELPPWVKVNPAKPCFGEGAA